MINACVSEVHLTGDKTKLTFVTDKGTRKFHSPTEFLIEGEMCDILEFEITDFKHTSNYIELANEVGRVIIKHR